MPVVAFVDRFDLQIKSVRNPYQIRKKKMKVTLNQVIKVITAAESAYGKVVAMKPSIKAAKIKKDDLRKALQEAWGFKAMTPKSTAYNNCKAKVAYWINVIFSESKPTAPTPFKLARGLTDKFIQFLSENNISDKDMKRAANALAANIILK